MCMSRSMAHKGADADGQAGRFTAYHRASPYLYIDAGTNTHAIGRSRMRLINAPLTAACLAVRKFTCMTGDWASNIVSSPAEAIKVATEFTAHPLPLPVVATLESRAPCDCLGDAAFENFSKAGNHALYSSPAVRGESLSSASRPQTRRHSPRISSRSTCSSRVSRSTLCRCATTLQGVVALIATYASGMQHEGLLLACSSRHLSVPRQVI